MGYYKTQTDGSRVYIEGDSKELANSVDITAAKTLVAQDSGSTFYLNAVAGVAITLPDVSLRGFNAEFIIAGNFATTDFTIVSATNVIQGVAVVDGAAVKAVDENTISFVATAESIGDHIVLKSDGTNFIVKGVGASTGSITFTAP